MKKYVVLIIAMLLLVLACNKKILAPAIIEKTFVKDSIVETVRDSLIVIPADSAWLTAYLECDSIGQVYIKQLIEYETGKNIKPPVISIEKNILNALSSTDSISIYLTLKERYHEKITDNVIYEKEILEVNRLTKLQGFWIISGYIFAGLLLLSVGYGGFKLYRKLLR